MEVGSAAKNSGWVLAGRGSERLFRIVVVIVLARILGVRGFGIYSFAFAFAEMFAILADAGLHPILVREVARNRESASRLLGNAIYLKVVLALVSWVSACVMAIWTVPPGESLWASLIASFLLFISFRVTSFRTIFDVPFESNLRMATPIVMGIGSEFFSAVSLIWAAWNRWPIPALIGVQLVAFLPGVFFLAKSAFQEIEFERCIDVKLWFWLLRMAVPVGIANFFLIAYTRTDILMLGWMTDEVSVGMYSAAFKLTGSLTIVPTTITTSLLPLLSAAFREGDTERVRRIFRTAFSISVAVGLPVAVGGFLLADEIVRTVYGGGFEEASKALQVLAFAMFFNFTLYVMTTTAVSVGRTGLFTAYAGVLTVLNIGLNLLLIPSYGIVGASWATLIAEGVLMMTGLAILRPNVGFPSAKATLRAVIAAVLAGIVLNFFPGSLIWAIPGSAALYAVAVCWGEGITPEGAAAFWKLFRVFSRSRLSESP